MHSKAHARLDSTLRMTGIGTSAYSPGLAPTDIPALKGPVSGLHFQNNSKVEQTGCVTIFCITGHRALPERFLQSGNDCML